MALTTKYLPILNNLKVSKSLEEASSNTYQYNKQTNIT